MKITRIIDRDGKCKANGYHDTIPTCQHKNMRAALEWLLLHANEKACKVNRMTITALKENDGAYRVNCLQNEIDGWGRVHIRTTHAFFNVE